MRDILKVKIGQLYREERELRKKYKEEWIRAEDVWKKNSREWKRSKRLVGDKMEAKRKREEGVSDT